MGNSFVRYRKRMACRGYGYKDVEGMLQGMALAGAFGYKWVWVGWMD
jgi:hypothetical protein